MLLLLYIPNIKTINREIGDAYYLTDNINKYKLCHPFTTFYNHNNSIDMEPELTKCLL